MPGNIIIIEISIDLTSFSKKKKVSKRDWNASYDRLSTSTRQSSFVALVIYMFRFSIAIKIIAYDQYQGVTNDDVQTRTRANVGNEQIVATWRGMFKERIRDWFDVMFEVMFDC